MPEARQLGSVVVVFVVFVDEFPVAVVALRYSRAVKLTSEVGVDPEQRNVPFFSAMETVNMSSRFE